MEEVDSVFDEINQVIESETKSEVRSEANSIRSNRGNTSAIFHDAINIPNASNTNSPVVFNSKMEELIASTVEEKFTELLRRLSDGNPSKSSDVLLISKDVTDLDLKVEKLSRKSKELERLVSQADNNNDNSKSTKKSNISENAGNIFVQVPTADSYKNFQNETESKNNLEDLVRRKTVLSANQNGLGELPSIREDLENVTKNVTVQKFKYSITSLSLKATLLFVKNAEIFMQENPVHHKIKPATHLSESLRKQLELMLKRDDRYIAHCGGRIPSTMEILDMDMITFLTAVLIIQRPLNVDDLNKKMCDLMSLTYPSSMSKLKCNVRTFSTVWFPKLIDYVEKFIHYWSLLTATLEDFELPLANKRDGNTWDSVVCEINNPFRKLFKDIYTRKIFSVFNEMHGENGKNIKKKSEVIVKLLQLCLRFFREVDKLSDTTRKIDLILNGGEGGFESEQVSNSYDKVKTLVKKFTNRNYKKPYNSVNTMENISTESEFAEHLITTLGLEGLTEEELQEYLEDMFNDVSDEVQDDLCNEYIDNDNINIDNEVEENSRVYYSKADNVDNSRTAKFSEGYSNRAYKEASFKKSNHDGDKPKLLCRNFLFTGICNNSNCGYEPHGHNKMVNGKSQFQGKISKDAIENTFKVLQNAVMLRNGYKDHHNDNNINSKNSYL